MIVDENCDMRYLSKDKTYPNQSSMSKNFYHFILISVCICVAEQSPDCRSEQVEDPCEEPRGQAAECCDKE